MGWTFSEKKIYLWRWSLSGVIETKMQKFVDYRKGHSESGEWKMKINSSSRIKSKMFIALMKPVNSD